MKELKLFVWTGFSPDYTNGLAFAIAEDVTEAMRMVEKYYRGKPYEGKPYEWGELNIYPTTKKIARCVSGGG